MASLLKLIWMYTDLGTWSTVREALKMGLSLPGSQKIGPLSYSTEGLAITKKMWIGNPLGMIGKEWG